jgi:hypothetical protein
MELIITLVVILSIGGLVFLIRTIMSKVENDHASTDEKEYFEKNYLKKAPLIEPDDESKQD